MLCAWMRLVCCWCGLTWWCDVVLKVVPRLSCLKCCMCFSCVGCVVRLFDVCVVFICCIELVDCVMCMMCVCVVDMGWRFLFWIYCDRLCLFKLCMCLNCFGCVVWCCGCVIVGSVFIVYGVCVDDVFGWDLYGLDVFWCDGLMCFVVFDIAFDVWQFVYVLWVVLSSFDVFGCVWFVFDVWMCLVCDGCVIGLDARSMLC